MEQFLRMHGMEELCPERELKRSERGYILLLRHRNTGQRFVFREHAGSGTVYQKLKGLSCLHLPQILAVSEQNDRVMVLEEYIQGDSLTFLLEGVALTQTQAKTIAIQVCRALTALHGLGVVHRDVKPENILLRGSEAVLIDFDASRTYKENTSGDTRIMGTTGYAAPEQYGFSQTDARSDIYSMGILLNEMLTGMHPSTKLADGALRPVVEKCIAVNAAMRYPTAAELITALEKSASPGKPSVFLIVPFRQVVLYYQLGGEIYI